MKSLLTIIGLSIAGCLWAAPFHSDSELRKIVRSRVVAEIPSGVEARIGRLFVKEPVSREATLTWLEPQPPVGTVQLEFSWMESNARRRVTGNVDVAAFSEVAVAKTPIRHGEIFSTTNVSVERREITQIMRAGFYQSLQSLSAMRANGYIRPGTIIAARHAQPPYWVEAGQTVSLVREGPSLRVEVQVKALQKGRQSDWIRVENPSTHKVLTAEVVGYGKVRLP